jgi:hypothetical protein
MSMTMRDPLCGPVVAPLDVIGRASAVAWPGA